MALEPVFEADAATDAAEGERFMVDVDGFEGPLDLLLELARRQKVDLQRVSILDLANQYLAFVDQARKVRLELAADYLVMAAWLAYLKSRLLLPRAAKADEPEAGDLAAALAARLQNLEVIRLAAQALGERPQLGRDFGRRGCPDETILEGGPPRWDANLYDLISAYAKQRQKRALTQVRLKKRMVWSLTEARDALQRLSGQALDWMVLDDYLMAYCVTPGMRRTVKASALCAALEMVREGHLSVRQDEAFAPLWIKSRDAGYRQAGRHGAMEAH
jgi:segregation and condensation protein A